MNNTTSNNNIEVRIVEEKEEIHKAQDTVQKVYESASFFNKGENSFEEYLKKNRVITFGVYKDDILFSTCSLIYDGENGLPLDTLYKKEIDIYREKGCTVVEISQYATDTEKSDTKQGAMLLYEALRIYIDASPIEILVVCVHPKYQSFYEMLGFVKKGEEKMYEKVHAIAVCMVYEVSVFTSH